jgi:ABC-type transport system substrate-binding protein
LSLATALTVPAGSQAESKKDGRSDGGVLGYGEYGRPATLDPITSNEMISVRITELVFNGLVAIDEKQEIVPDLAERWEASKDGRTYAFFLRKDVTWHPKEGEEARPLTADDVSAQLGDAVDLVIDSGCCAGGTPSTVVDCSMSPPRIVREGAITREELVRAAGVQFA